MAYNVLLTSLYSTGEDDRVEYYYSKFGYRTLYCDAMMTVEATTKYMLANYPVDEIIVLGHRTTFDEGDDDRLIPLNEGKSFYAADTGALSSYSLYRYRIAQFLDELKIEQQDLNDLLPKEEQDKVISFARKYREELSQSEAVKFNRLFDHLAQDTGAYHEFLEKMFEEIPEADKDRQTYIEWVNNYLFTVMKDSGKMEPLPENDDVKVRFIQTDDIKEGRIPVSHTTKLMEAIEKDGEKVNLYVAISSDDLTDNFVLLNAIDYIDLVYGDRIELAKLMTTSISREGLAGQICDNVKLLSVSELVSATKTFLKYGKADMMVELWEKLEIRNEHLANIIYAMRRIDIGISLCMIDEITNGIEELREAISVRDVTLEEDYNQALFELLRDMVLRDYGPLLEGDHIEFFDLVKWTSRKNFYQQTLTLIESQAPRDFVKRGVFYYCDDEEEKEHVTELFAREKNQLRPFEQYQMNDLEHYYVKIYGRRTYRRKGNDLNRTFANYRTWQLDNTSPEFITSHTMLEDRELLQELLYTYYRVGDIRNKTNHAEETRAEEHRLFMDQKEVPVRMSQIQEVITYFLLLYDKAIESLEGVEPNVVPISLGEVTAEARKLQAEEDKEKEKEKK